jgi:hypothetical protein
MKKLILILTISLSINYGFTQCLTAKGLGKDLDDHAVSTAVDNNGNVYFTGAFDGQNVDFDPGPSTFYLSSGGSSIRAAFLSKFDINGNLLWAIKYGNPNSFVPKDILVDDLGNPIICGGGYDNLTPNGGTPHNGHVFKFDTNGTILWDSSIGGRPNSIFADGVVLYVVGSFEGSEDFNPDYVATSIKTSAGGSDIFILGLSLQTGLLNTAVRTIGGLGDDFGMSITVNSLGYTYVTGSFQGTVDFNFSSGVYNLTSNGGSDIFVLKLSVVFTYTSSFSFGGTGNDIGMDIATDNTDNVYLTGSFENTVDFNFGTAISNLTSLGGKDLYVSKIDPSNNFLWAKKSGGLSDDEGLSIAYDNTGNIFCTGYYLGSSDFDPSTLVNNLISSGSSNDIFIWKLDSNGNFIWANSYGGNGDDKGLCIVTDNSGNPFSSGYFSTIADFNPGAGVSNLTSNGGKDIYIQFPFLDVPTISANGPISFCPGGSVTLTSSSTTGNTWSTGATTQSIVVNSAGSYTVAYSNGTCVTNSTPINVTILTAPSVPTINANSPTTFCSGGNVTLTSSSATGNTWSNGATTQAITVNSGGNYSVTATNGTCSTASIPQQIYVIQYPATPTITSNSATSFCPGGSVTLTSSSATGNLWSNGMTTQSIIVSSQGSYTVSNANGLCVSNSTPIVTSILPAPATPTISASGTTSFCEGNSVILTSNSATNNIWSTGETSQSIVVNTTGDYDVIVSNGTCSTSSNPTQVSVISYPNIPLITANGPTTFCLGDSVVLSSTATSGNSWSNGSNNQSITVLASDTYSVSVSNGSCISNSQTLTVTTIPSPIINTQPTNTQVNIGNQAVFTISANGGTYQWQVNSGSGFQSITNGGQYSGATTNTLTVSNTSMSNNTNQYQCIVTSNNCSTTSNVATLTVINNVGLSEVDSWNNIEIYPNPTSNFVTISFTNNLLGSKYQIVDNTGRIVLSGLFLDENQIIDMTQLSRGIYNLYVLGANSKTLKLVKE